ncbi:RcpC/CpaB family pilus assembly protein [Nonomuraea sp. NPDC046802]|uniref:RcpC/CpaB family pilus assembly protein n=1 Tax=Nonomuraea sp. NPDC046802 TaxID=3154919 RepID=UPI0033D938CE
MSRYARRRRLLAAALAALAVISTFFAIRPATPTTTALVATRDLSPGPLRPGDLRAVPLNHPPAGAVRTTVSGQILATPMRKGEPLTDVRLLRTFPLSPGLVATPVRISDPAAAALLSPGSTISVLATMSEGNPMAAHPVAQGVTVITIPASTRQSTTGNDRGALVVLGTTPAQAAALAAAQAHGHLAITIEPNRQ